MGLCGPGANALGTAAGKQSNQPFFSASSKATLEAEKFIFLVNAQASVAPKTPRSRWPIDRITYSATESALAPAAGMTSTSRARQAGRSML